MTTVRSGVKIGLMGAGGTGKTTDATVIAEKTGLKLMKSASREVYEKMKLTEEMVAQLPDNKKWELQGHIFQVKQYNDDNTYEFIADRTLLDHWSYCLMYCGTFLPNADFLEYETIVRKHMKSAYTHLFYYPWGYWTEPSDGVRQDHWSWQSAIDAMIVGYCHRWSLPVVQVPQAQGKETRQQFVLNHLLGKPEEK